jgi:benzodiazapine receptor
MASIPEQQQASGESREMEVPASIMKSRYCVSNGIANLIAYLLNSVITYTSLTGIFGATNTELSDKYTTLINPNGAAFAIWGPIFIWEFFFVVAQLTQNYKNSAVVQKLTPWWCAACFFQALWTLFFAQEFIEISLVCMLGILFSLLGLVWTVDRLPFMSYSEFWLLRAPFSLHLGWITVASLLNVNLLADSLRAEPGVLLALAVVSLACVLVSTALHALASPRPDAIVCLVAAWATWFIFMELKDPTNLLSKTRFNPYHWEAVVLEGLKSAALMLCCVSLLLATIALVQRVYANPIFRIFRKVQVNEADASGEQTSADGVIAQQADP